MPRANILLWESSTWEAGELILYVCNGPTNFLTSQIFTLLSTDDVAIYLKYNYLLLTIIYNFLSSKIETYIPLGSIDNPLKGALWHKTVANGFLSLGDHIETIPLDWPTHITAL